MTSLSYFQNSNLKLWSSSPIIPLYHLILPFIIQSDKIVHTKFLFLSLNGPPLVKVVTTAVFCHLLLSSAVAIFSQIVPFQVPAVWPSAYQCHHLSSNNFLSLFLSFPTFPSYFPFFPLFSSLFLNLPRSGSNLRNMIILSLKWIGLFLWVEISLLLGVIVSLISGIYAIEYLTKWPFIQRTIEKRKKTMRIQQKYYEANKKIVISTSCNPGQRVWLEFGR